MCSPRLRLAVPLAALALAASACGMKSEPVGVLPSFPRSAQDGAGRTVTVKAQPTRIVSLDPGLTETAMRAGDIRARIPMARGTDSLNVATAAATQAAAPPPSEDRPARLREEAVREPAVQEALDLFNGRVLEVRESGKEGL